MQSTIKKKINDIKIESSFQINLTLNFVWSCFLFLTLIELIVL